MPKVKINNAQGLVQSEGGGVALYGATQTLGPAANTPNAADSLVLPTTSLVLATPGAGPAAITLPATGSLDAGHTVLAVNVHASNALNVFPTDQSGGERVNGVAGGAAQIDAKCAAEFIYSGKNNPGWVVIMGSTDEVPS